MHAARAEGARAEAVDCAKAAAPYVHPKLAPTSPLTLVESFFVFSHARVRFPTVSDSFRQRQLPKTPGALPRCNSQAAILAGPTSRTRTGNRGLVIKLP